MSSSKRIFVLLIATLIILTACTTTPTPSNTPTSSPPTTATHIPTSTSTQAPTPTFTPTSTEIVFDPPVREITVLYTNDEQGWMEGVEEGRGAANMVGV